MKERDRKESEFLPRDPHSGRERPARKQPGYYPGYSTMSQSKFWDAATRNLIRDRMESPPPRRFFTEGNGDSGQGCSIT